jgi:threonylcarbamoyladenosine tRNA methylthiotransferase MtaB
LAEPLVLNAPAASRTFAIAGAGHEPSHTRANLKVQEGCDFVCAFCIIPRSRGRARSRDFADALREARALVAAGHREIVVTGVNIGTYRDGTRTLADLVQALEDIDGLARIRLSSIEPTTIADEIIAEMARGGKLCPYLHVPMQSGDDAVLARMRRRYDAAEYQSFLETALERVPHLGLGTDVIVGFPGETEAAFERSCEAIARLPFVNTHVFSFSARPRTSAFSMGGQVAPAEIRRRSERLRRVALARKHEVYAAQVGRSHGVLLEERAHDGRFIGFSDSYVRVKVASHEDLRNRMASVFVSDVELSDGIVAVGSIARSA